MDFTTLVLALLAASPQTIAEAFTGSWLMDVETGQPLEVERLTLDDGIFSRGNAELDVPADGEFHPVHSNGHVDEIAVTVVNAYQVRECDRLDGSLVYSVIYTVSPDGNSMTRQVTDLSKPEGEPITAEVSHRRLGDRDPSSALLTGRWETIKVDASRDMLTEKLKVHDNIFSISAQGGYGYDAVLGGPPVAVRGDAKTARVAVTMPNARTITHKMSLDGVPTVVMTMALQPDNKTIEVTGQRLEDGSTFGWTMHKQ